MRSARLGLGAAAIFGAMLLAGVGAPGCSGDDNGTGTPGAGDAAVTDAASSPLDATTTDAGDTGAPGHDGGADTSVADTGAAAKDSGPLGDAGCVTTTPDGGGQVLFAFDHGNVTGWTAAADQDSADSGFSPTATGSTTVGRSCPGSLVMTVPFTAYGNETSEIRYNFTGTVFTGTALHLYVKVVTPVATNGAEAGAADSSAAEASVAADATDDASADDGAADADIADGAASDADAEVADAGVADAGGESAADAALDAAIEAGPLAYSALDYVGAYTQWDTYTSTASTNPDLEINATFGDQWQELVIPLPLPQDGAPDFSEMMSKVAVLIATKVAPPAGGPAQPSAVQVYIDDIWLE